MREPRLWVPGVVYTSGAGDVRIGSSAGYGSRDASFAGLRCGWGGEITQWTHSAWVVPRADLTEEIVATHGVVLPESLLDRGAQPHAHRWLREQPLVAVSGATWSPLAEAGVRFCRIAFDAMGERLLRVDVTGPSRPPSSAVVAADAFRVATPGREESLFDRHGHPSLVDRLLRLLSDETFDESALLNAVDVRRLVEDGYGYRDARDGWFRGIDDVAHHLEPLDELFGQVFDRGDRMRPDAVELVAAIRGCAADVSEIVVDRRCVRSIEIVGLERRNVERLVVRGQEVTDLVLPAERRWALGAHDDWSPRRAHEVDTRQRAPASPRP